MKAQKVELPIQYEDIACVTECWTFNRLAIIRSSTFYEDWIASNYRLFVDECYNFFFGESCLHEPGYYDAILKRRNIPFYSIPVEEIVETLKRELALGRYIVMQVKSSIGKEYYHDVLFYGYDDAAAGFWAVGNMGREFAALQYSYSYIKDTFPEVRAYYQKNPDIALGTMLQFYPLMTTFEIDREFHVDNCPLEAYRKLNNEWCGNFLSTQTPDTVGKYGQESVIYHGIDCLYAFQLMLEKEMKGEKFDGRFRGVTISAKKLQEHQKMVLQSMEYLFRKWRVAMDSRAADNISEYGQCYQTVERWRNMVIKYEQTGEKRLLTKVVAEVPEIYRRERSCLDYFLHEGIRKDVIVRNFA